MRSFKGMMIFLALVMTLCSFGASWFGQGPRRQVETLVITGNFKSPRLLAELIQSESRQPYLLLPVPGSEDSRIFFCPSRNICNEILANELNDFVRYLNPKRIVVLGDAKFVQPKYVALLDRAIPVVQIDCVDWNLVAEQLTDLLNLTRLAGDYKELRETMLNDAKIYRPVSRPAPVQPKAAEPPMEEVAAEETVEEAVEVPVAE